MDELALFDLLFYEQLLLHFLFFNNFTDNHFANSLTFLFVNQLLMSILFSPFIEKDIGISICISLGCVFSLAKSFIFKVFNMIIFDYVIIELEPFFSFFDILCLSVFYYRVIVSRTCKSIMNDNPFKLKFEVFFI